MMALLLLFLILSSIVRVIAMWPLFEKAGEAGATALIPIYNNWKLYEIAGKPGWISIIWLPVAFISFGNSVLLAAAIHLFVMPSLARSFGKSNAFGVGLALLPIVFFPLLGFDRKAQYRSKEETLFDRVDEIGQPVD